MKLLRAVLVGSLVAIVFNLAIFLALRLAGAFGPEVVAIAAGAPLSAAPVVVASVAGVLAAAIARLALGVVFRRSLARWAFLGLSTFVLLVSFVSPLRGLAGAGAVEILALELMHVATAVAAVAAVEWGTRPQWGFGRATYPERDGIVPHTALVTGATGGIGAEVAVELAARGFRVIGIGRSVDKARAVEHRARQAGGEATILTGDLGSMRRAAQLAREAAQLAPEGFSAVVHCAGTLKPRSVTSEEGIDEGFATSFLSRVCVTAAVSLAEGARLVNVAAAEGGPLPQWLRMELAAPEDIASGMRAHGQAQLANDLWVARLARQGVAAFGYGPGSVSTDIRRELPAVMVALMKPLFWAETRSARDAALDVVRLLLDRDLPPGGFASRDGWFEHDPFVMDAARQDRLAALAEALLRRATARPAAAQTEAA